MNRRRAIPAAVLAALLLLAACAAAQMPKPEEVVALRVEPPAVKARPGGPVEVTLLATIKKGFHVNSSQPTLDYLIPSRVEVVDTPGFTLEKASFPEGELKAFGFAPDEPLSVYEGVVRVPLKLRARKDVAAGPHTVRLAFRYQACNDRLCLRPASRQATFEVQLQ
jgi:hypothetical protein